MSIYGLLTLGARGLPAPRKGWCRVRGRRILVIGASGAGTSTLGRGLADRLASQHFDIDDFFWEPTDPPFRKRREPAQRLPLMQALFLPRSDWVLSGSPVGWGDAVIERLTHVIFMTLDPGERLARLAARERQRHGELIGPGGEREIAYRAFMEWARGYDSPAFPQRSRCVHQAWLAELRCPLLRLDSEVPLDALLAEALDWMAGADSAGNTDLGGAAGTPSAGEAACGRPAGAESGAVSGAEAATAGCGCAQGG